MKETEAEAEPESILSLQKSAKAWPLIKKMIILCIHTLGLGFGLYFTSLTVPYHKTALSGYMLMSEDVESWYLSIFPLTMFIVSHVANLLAEWLGRKKTLLLSNGLTITSMLVMYFAPNYPLLFIGRAIGGFGTGSGIIVALVYSSEIATIKLRPGFAAIFNIALAAGTLILYVVNMVLPPEYLHFFVMSISLVFIVLATLVLPESPHWLVRRERLEDAAAAYRSLRGQEYKGVQREIEEIQTVLRGSSTENDQKKSRWMTRRFLHPLGILVFLCSSIGLCGLEAINIYGPSMFAVFGFVLPYKVVQLIIPIGGFLGYSLGLALFGCMSKKHQYVAASTLMAISAGCIGFAYYVKDSIDGNDILAQALFSIGSLGIPLGYGAGIGAVVYALPGELLAPEDKAVGVSTAQSCRLLTTFVSTKVYPYVLRLVGYPGMFTFHGVTQVLSALFVIGFLPETRDKSIAELDEMFKKKGSKNASTAKQSRGQGNPAFDL